MTSTNENRGGRKHAVILGRLVKVKPQAVTARDLMRAHYARAGLRQKQVAPLMNMTHGSFRKWITSRNQISPQHIDIFIERLNLPPDAALQLRLQAAIDQGWQLDDLKPRA
jgi:hypothetical protein